MPCIRLQVAALVAVLLSASPVVADVALNNMFGDHMVLQQGIRNKVWGKADPGEEVTVTLGPQKHSTTAAADGTWHVFLDPVEDYGGPHVLTVQGRNTLAFNDVLIGEVWICSGQSNMEWPVNQCKDADLEKAAATDSDIRLLTVPSVGTQEPQWNFNGQWQVCSPQTVGRFSAVGYHFGRQLHETLGVPVGLVNNAWGGSAAEGWVRRDKLAAHPELAALEARWKKMEADCEAALADYERDRAAWQEEAEKAKAEEKPVPPEPAKPNDAALRGNFRPGNIHAGVLTPSIGYGIRGVIWYQGESNASRAWQYRTLFPFLIASWREEWGIGDFPFYWVQLADYRAEKADPAESEWAELREAQSLALAAVPNGGEAVAIDMGEAKDIHPQNKQDVARRLARWALAETYEVPGITCQSPRYTGMETEGGRVVLSFDHVSGGWRPFDVGEPLGFTIAGADRKFVAAQAAIRKDGRIEVWSDTVPEPVAVRYAWADNPVCNLYSGVGLPLTPFRTDDFPAVTKGRE